MKKSRKPSEPARAQLKQIVARHLDFQLLVSEVQSYADGLGDAWYEAWVQEVDTQLYDTFTGDEIRKIGEMLSKQLTPTQLARADYEAIKRIVFRPTVTAITLYE